MIEDTKWRMNYLSGHTFLWMKDLSIFHSTFRCKFHGQILSRWWHSVIGWLKPLFIDNFTQQIIVLVGIIHFINVHGTFSSSRYEGEGQQAPVTRMAWFDEPVLGQGPLCSENGATSPLWPPLPVTGLVDIWPAIDDTQWQIPLLSWSSPCVIGTAVRNVKTQLQTPFPGVKKPSMNCVIVIRSAAHLNKSLCGSFSKTVLSGRLGAPLFFVASNSVLYFYCVPHICMQIKWGKSA